MVSYFKQNQKREMGFQDIEKNVIVEMADILQRDEEARRGNILSIKRESGGGVIIIQEIGDEGVDRGDQGTV